jgi:hypothetical protein
LIHISGWGANLMDLRLAADAYQAGIRQAAADAARLRAVWAASTQPGYRREPGARRKPGARRAEGQPIAIGGALMKTRPALAGTEDLRQCKY